MTSIKASGAKRSPYWPASACWSCVCRWERRSQPHPSSSSIRTGPNPCRTSGRWAASPGWPWIRMTTSGCYDRPNDLTDIELEAELTPPIADCCVRPPSMIHIDKNGNVIGSFDAPQGHGMAVDSKGFVYIGAGHGPQIRSEDRQTGRRSASHAGEAAGRRWRRWRSSDVSPRSGPWQRRAGCGISHAARADALARSGGSSGSGGGDRGLPRQVSSDHADDRGRTRRDSARRTGSRTLRRRQLPGRARDGV